jgi:hypothetical protein
MQPCCNVPLCKHSSPWLLCLVTCLQTFMETISTSITIIIDRTITNVAFTYLLIICFATHYLIHNEAISTSFFCLPFLSLRFSNFFYSYLIHHFFFHNMYRYSTKVVWHVITNNWLMIFCFWCVLQVNEVATKGCASSLIPMLNLERSIFPIID